MDLWSSILIGALAGCSGTKDPRHPDLADSADTDGSDASDSDPAPTDGQDTDTAVPPAALVFTVEPATFPNPNPAAPMVHILTAETNLPSRLSASLVSDSQNLTIPFETLDTTHEVDLLGMYADASFEVAVTATTDEGESIRSEPITLVTAPLPDRFPRFQILRIDPSRLEPGYTVFWDAVLDPYTDFLVALDNLGEVVWFHTSEQSRFQEVHRHANGNLQATLHALTPYGVHHVVEMNMRGDQLVRYSPGIWSEPGDVFVDTHVFHHDVQEGPDDTFFVLGIEELYLPSWPTSESNPDAPPAPSTLAADVVLQVAADGTVVDRFPYADYLDPGRIGYDSVVHTFWGSFFGPGTKDWAHANAIHYDADDDALLLSSRHLDAVFMVDRATRELRWILGPHANWDPAWQPYLLQPVGPNFRWSFHQHAPELTPSGTVLLFDNGNNRASAFEPKLPDNQNRSRAVEYAIDPVAMTAELVWQFGGEVDMFCPFMGDANLLPETGNVQVLFGAVTHGNRDHGVRIFEVTHTSPPEVLLEIGFEPNEVKYRVLKLPSLYP